MAAAIVSASRVRELFNYDRETGRLIRLLTTASTAKAGCVAGSPQSGGYRCVYVDGRLYKEHRLIWLHVHGCWPTGQIDHINGVRDDNRISNLREVSPAQNSENRRSARRGKKDGCPLGVHRNHGRFSASIRVGGQFHYLGSFTTQDEAHSAYLEAKRRLHTACTI